MEQKKPENKLLADKVIGTEQTKEPPKKKQIEPPGKVSVSESVGIGTRVRELEAKLKILGGNKEEKLKSKRFPFPAKVKASTRNIKRMIEKNKVNVIYLKQSGGIQPTIGEYKDGMIVVGNNIHNATDDIFWNWMGKNIPTAIIPEWDLQPITRRGLMKDTEELKTQIHPQNIIIRSMEAREQIDKMKAGQLSTKVIIIGIIGIIVIVGILFKGQ